MTIGALGLFWLLSSPMIFAVGTNSWKHRQPFRRQGDCEEAHAGHIAAWPVETGHEAGTDWVAPSVKDDRNCRCRGFCGLRRGDTTQCGNHCDPTADQVGREGRQPVELASQAEPIHDEGRDSLLGVPRVLRPNCVGLGLPAGPLSRPSLGAWHVVRGDVAGTRDQAIVDARGANSTASRLPVSRLPALPCCPYLEWQGAAVPKPFRAARRSALRDQVARPR